jgi:2-polyprenyl-3-methyl-5-hydroxy-6-metoxy-1,4-benzoquinol methylase
MRLVKLAGKALRRTWMRYALRGVGGNDNHARLDLAYRIADPWNMDSQLEQFRFARTNALIERHFPGCRSILEIGCGEGHQSEHLAKLCSDLYGIDVSATAVERAKKRLPGAEFFAGDVFTQPWGRQRGRFDLVVACEVLYYVADVERTLAEMSHLGKACLVTIFAPAIRRVGAHLEAIPGVGKDWFGGRGAEWVVAYWRSPPAAVSDSTASPVDAARLERRA